MPMNFDEVAQEIRRKASNTKEAGTAFEHATKYFLKNDPLWSQRFSDVWLWSESPTNDGRDIGIDLVARDALSGGYWAIQCKFYGDQSLTYKELSTFFATAAAKHDYEHYMIVDTATVWSQHLQKIADQYNTIRIDSDALSESNIDWTPFIEGKSAAERTTFDARKHQREAIDACAQGFKTGDRGKLIMACGTGKTLTALRLAEEMYPDGGLILFLAPSISLVSQTLRAWANQSRQELHPLVVCSDATASKIEDAWETSVSEIPYPSTTDTKELVKQYQEAQSKAGLTVVFSTYQSIQVVGDAQRDGLPTFDLIVCDEAHRTTGAREIGLSAADQSAFTKVHDNTIVAGDKRLYMTATPRLYGDKAKRQAREESYVVSSMDDETIYGPEFYHLSFGQAVEDGLLSDYRVVALTVGEDMASAVYQQAMTQEEEGFGVPEAAKIIGCWKALSYHGEKAGEIHKPLTNAVAFCSTIAESERMASLFTAVVDAYRQRSEGEEDEEDLLCETKHIDGTMNSNERKRLLTWLAEEQIDDDSDAPICRILSNARCLAEGVDVPNLSAVMFMKPRKSQIDIVQAVGRVMRKYEGKQYGYIILPVIAPAGMTPEEALDDNESFKVVWQVLQALRSHDERLDARINALRFESTATPPVEVISVDPPKSGDDEEAEGDDTTVTNDGEYTQMALTVEQWQDAVNAQIAKRCGTRVYWEDWADDISKIAVRQIERIKEVVTTKEETRERFGVFLKGLRDSLNPGITEDDAIEMLAQHIITLPVFGALFGGADFAKSNPVSIAMEEMLAALSEYGLTSQTENDELRALYRSVEIRASQIKSDAGRQKVIKELYEGFFSKAFKATSEKMGIVYTPNEIVTYILQATNRMLQKEFGQSLEDEGVHILDPFTGTGTFIVDLITSDLISDEKLPHKYAHELHANEILLLAYYIATINIEHAYHSRKPGEYVPFPGAVLTDTFQMTEGDDKLDLDVFVENSERVLQQNALPITVIVGNPPYSSKQTTANDNNANASYPTIDARIRERYVGRSVAVSSNAVYDSYIRAIRWATDRIGERGVITYVSNAGWLDGSAMDGMRKSLAEEFNSIYVFNLRGNQRTQGEESRREGGKIFGSGSRAPIAITILVKNPDSVDHGVIHYYDIGDYLSRDEKIAIVRKKAKGEEVDWETLLPDSHGDWLNQRDDAFYQFAPMGMEKRKEPRGVFDIWSNGLKTQRDAWAYGFSCRKMLGEMERLVEAYNSEVDRYEAAGKPRDVRAFIDYDPVKLSWTRRLEDYLQKGTKVQFSDCSMISQYRPFVKQWVYYNWELNEMTYQQPRLFPLAQGKGKKAERTYQQHLSDDQSEKGGVEMTYQQYDPLCFGNVTICVTGTSGKEFSTFISDIMVDLNLMNAGAQCFPICWYEKQEALGGLFDDAEQETYIKHEAITDEALGVFQKAYPDLTISKEDIFYYIYGVFHSPEYRSRFSANLKKELPRIPLSRNFTEFTEAGRALAELHLNYETIEPWPLTETGKSDDPGRVEKMRWGKKGKAEDKTVIVYNENLTLSGIPEEAHRYMVNGKTALGWLLDRYRVTIDKASGIVNDPNDYSDDPRYIVDLIKRVTRVSVETMEIVDALPALDELPQPDFWPAAWKLA